MNTPFHIMGKTCLFLRSSRNIPALMLCSMYLIIYLFFMGNAPFIFDDGVWTYAAVNFIDHHAPFIGFESTRGGIPHSPLGAYMHAFFYFIYPSIYSVLFGVLFINVLAQFVIIKLGELLGSRLWGYGASLLFFFSPPFFLLMSYRTWQVTYMPFFCMTMLYCLVKFCRPGGHWLYVPAAFAMWGGSYQLHPTAILMLPLLFVILFLSKNFKTLKPAQYITSCLVLLLVPFPFIVALYEKGLLYYLLIPFSAMLLFCYVCRKSDAKFFKPFHSEQFEKYALWLFLIIAVIGICICRIVYPNFETLGMFQRFIEMLPANNRWIAEYIGFDVNRAYWNYFFSYVLSLEVLLWFFYIARNLIRYSTLTISDKIIFYANIIPPVLFIFFPVVLGLPQWEICWPYTLFFFPVPFLAIMKSATSFIPQRKSSFPFLKEMSYALIVIIISLNIFVSLFLSNYVLQTGGICGHWSSLGIKMDVLEYIYQHDSNPEIIIAMPDGDRIFAMLTLGGWNMVGYEVKKQYEAGNTFMPVDGTSVPGQKKYFYIFESQGKYLEMTRSKAAALESDAGVSKKQFKSVTLYSSTDYKKNIGPRLRCDYEQIFLVKFFYAQPH